jgi:hypothetical protein
LRPFHGTSLEVVCCPSQISGGERARLGDIP